MHTTDVGAGEVGGEFVYESGAVNQLHAMTCPVAMPHRPILLLTHNVYGDISINVRRGRGYGTVPRSLHWIMSGLG